MAEFSHRNLCPTVEPRYRYETLKCVVGHAIDPYQNGGRTWAYYHRWPNADRKHGHCLNCGLTLKDVTVRINPKTGEPVRRASRIAREIALTPADVPPVRFVR